MTDKNNQIFILEGYQVCIIADYDERKPELGTGFLFLKNDWIVTAAHVVMHEGLPRKNLYAEFPTGGNNKLKIEVVAVHKEIDVAITKITARTNPCSRPLYPGYDDLSVSKGLVICGYTPSKGRSITISLAKTYEKQVRERIAFETILEFHGHGIEPGSSGGPILGDGGVVLGMLINLFALENEPDKIFARATSIQNVVKAVSFNFDSTVFNLLED